MDDADRIAALECELANARADASDLQQEFAEIRRALNRIARGAELQARVMRAPLQPPVRSGAEKVADAFDDIAERTRAAVQVPEAKSPPG